MQYFTMQHEAAGGAGKVGTGAEHYKLKWRWFSTRTKSFSSLRGKKGLLCPKYSGEIELK